VAYTPPEVEPPVNVTPIDPIGPEDRSMTRPQTVALPARAAPKKTQTQALNR